jgi:ribosomal protein S12 methylthiotransferase
MVTDELLAAAAETEQVCHYFDIPVQHSDPDILRAMHRAGTASHVAGLTKRIRGMIPDAAIRTAVITGFPGESEKKFQGLLEYVKSSRFDHLGVFTFSPEEGTAAAKLPDRPSAKAAEHRRNTIMQIQSKLVRDRQQGMISQTDEVLLETRSKEDNNVWVARSQRLAPEVDGAIYVTGAPEDSKPGDFVKVTFTDSEGYDMMAEAKL